MKSLPSPVSACVASWAFLAAIFLPATVRAQRMELADASASPVVVETAEIKTEITGRLAVTTFDLVFRNPNSRVLEGTFALPLLDGQSVVRFALDINGAMREAVPVEKTKGRVVFEEIERRRVDPGLLEQTAGNNYRARIFPIPAGGTRRIVVAYQEDVLRAAADAPAYRLNLDFPEKLKKFRLAVVALTGGPAAQVRTTLGLDVPAWRDGRFMELERTNFTARGLLELTLPPGDRPRVLTGRHGDDEYFYAEAPVALTPRPRAVPKVVGLLWDSSGSGRDRDHKKEFALLDAWFAAVGSVEVRLIRLRDEAGKPETFSVQDRNWRKLRTALEKTDYDGATSLDGLADDPAVDEWLLFSDGLINYGVTPAAAKLKLRGAVHTLLASPRADPTWLRAVASRQRGEFVNLLEVAPAAAVTRLRSQSVRVLRVNSNPREVAEVFPEAGAAVTDGTVIVAGFLRTERATVELRIGTSESDAQTVEVAINAGETDSPLAARGWATAKIAQLSLNPVANRADLRRTSREFGIVTADTSLIVLETVADYVRYDIKPPAELRSEWSAHHAMLADNRSKSHDQHLESVVRAFQDRIAWWEQSFPKDKPPRAYGSKAKADRPEPARGGFLLRNSDAGPLASEPAPTGAPAPAATFGGVPPPRAVGGDSAGEVVTLQAFTISTERSSSASAIGASRAGRSRGPAAAKAGAQDTPGDPAAPVITLQRWSPNTGYLDRLNRADDGPAAYDVYLEERVRHSRQPGFFLDVANFFFEHDEPALGRRILSNLAELELEDVALLRVLAHRLVQAERADLALPLFERVLALRPDEPQSRRDLALACADLKRHQRAVDLLWEVVSQPWDPRFRDIELTALTELNAIAATSGESLDLSRIDRRLRRNLPLQTRVILTWDANDCDIDLWVTDPNAETAIYNHPLTYQGGRMSQDCTAGYGPEEFALRDAKTGKYRVQINYFGDARQTALGPVTAQVRLVTGFGTKDQQEKRLTVRLADRKQTLDIGTFEISARDKKLSVTAPPLPGD
ncbi:MAG: VIT domain-containing protein [Verrucomicrobia bacterium]|nr:VIT domain-containing protein [Verrucomicrobiota bacterium]